MTTPPPKMPTPIPLVPPTPPQTENAGDGRAEIVDNVKLRLKAVIFGLRKQVRNPSIIDGFLSCLSPATAIDGRMPFTPRPIIVIPDKSMLLHNALGNAVLAWGKFARNEVAEMVTTDLALLETIIRTGFAKYGAYPKDRNGAIHVLRSVDEERAIRKDRAAATERALEAKANKHVD